MGLFSWLFGNPSSGGQDLHEQKMERFEAALEKAQAGERFHDLLRQSNRKELERLKSTAAEVEKVEVLTGCCDTCDAALGGETFDLGEVLADGGPLPHPNCTRFTDTADYAEGWCVCEYVAAS